VIRLLSLLAGLVVLSVGCDAAVPSGGPPHGDAPTVTTGLDAAGIEAVLDAASRDLLTVVDPQESIEAEIHTPDRTGVAAAARSRGLTVLDIALDHVLVLGPVQPILQLIADVHPVSVALAEDSRADRWLPARRPDVAVPTPGSPYVNRRLVADLTRVAIPEGRRDTMLRSLAGLLVTIDGEPYARIELSGNCEPSQPPSCSISFSGSSRGAGPRADVVGISASAATNWIAQLNDGGGQLGSVPRPLLRAAEWIARHDEKAAAEIARYSSCCGATWFQPQPGLIELYYTRPCSTGAAAPDSVVASTGDCLEALPVIVDLRTGSVVRNQQPAGS
jgi:hypothetical protein